MSRKSNMDSGSKIHTNSLTAKKTTIYCKLLRNIAVKIILLVHCF
jgi:hypothetical protein